MASELIELKPISKVLFSKIKPLDYTQYHYSDPNYAIKRTENAKESAEALIECIKRCYSTGDLIKRDIIDLCWNLSLIEKYCKDICYINEDGKVFDYSYVDMSFKYIVTAMGFSYSTAYAYSSIGRNFCESDGKIKEAYKDYSISALIEFMVFKNLWYLCSEPYKVVPVTATVEEIRQYKKIMKLKGNGNEPFSVISGKDNTLYFKIKETTPLPEVLKLYSEWEQKQAVKQLEAQMSAKVETVESPAPKDNTTEDIIKFYQKQINELERTQVKELGNCDGCRHKETNLNKCRCCRRYKNLKDLFEV
ncbi:MAG: hypothetical protein NC131_17700 [Roseburia sp.]|nr:hypothetical protein [Roseburia sp.]